MREYHTYSPFIYFLDQQTLSSRTLKQVIFEKTWEALNCSYFSSSSLFTGNLRLDPTNKKITPRLFRKGNLIVNNDFFIITLLSAFVSPVKGSNTV